jgi:serine/threonine-protein kinase
MLGKTISHYLIKEQLGAGGMGVVYRARDARLGRDVALKLLPAEAIGDAAARSRLEREARTASALNHPNVCTIYDVGEAEGQVYLAMEFVAGQPLSRSIPIEGLPEAGVVRIGAQLADAIDHAHQQGITHRDLKTANVMLTPEGRAKILDFGLAVRKHANLGEVTQSRGSLADAGGISGTLSYMAPEVLRGQPADARSDLWALGVILFEMSAGHLPFRGNSGFDLTSSILRDAAPPLPQSLSPSLAGIIRKCLEKEPAQRYQRAGEVRAALEAIGLSTGKIPVAQAPRAQSARRNAILGVASLIVVGAILVALNAGGLRDRLLGRATVPQIRSIAVLPLENLSGDSNQEFFADGMTEALITELSQLSGLAKVTSRTSVMQYKRTRKGVPLIGQELGVDALVEGSVQRAGDRAAITVQLIDARADRHLWARTYDRDLRDILALQREVARAIAGEIQAKLTPAEHARLAAVRPVNPEAYQLCLQGRFYWNKRSPEGFEQAIHYFTEAVAKDPTYAPAYAGLADSYGLLGFFGFGKISVTEALPQALAAAGKAVALDDSSAEAHTSFGFVLMRYQWDWAGAEREFRRALELNSGYSLAHHWYALMLMSLGRREEGYREIMRARDLDPVSAIIATVAGLHFYYIRDFDTFNEWNRKALEIDPNFAIAELNLGRGYLQQQKFDQAISHMEKAVKISGDSPFYLGQLGHAYAVAGRKSEALKILERLKKESRPGYLSYPIAETYLGLGNKEQALAWLERAYQERSGWILYVKVEPKLDPLRTDTRFQELMRRMNFPQ